MAKFAQCGYGSSGQGLGKTTDGYTYVVNDNVRVGQRLQVIATSHGKTPKKFVTTAVPLNTYSENSVVGKKVKADLQKELGDKADNLTKAYSGGELGASGEITKKDVSVGTNKPQSEYTISSRALAVEKYKQSDPNAQFTSNTEQTLKYYNENKPTKGQKGGTFADYSKPFLKEGERLWTLFKHHFIQKHNLKN